MWTLCRREHWLTWADFMELTLAEYEALTERREIEIRHARFNAALVASSVLNVHRAEDTEPLSPFDFLAGFEEDPKVIERRKRRKEVKRAMSRAMLSIADGTPVEAVLEMRARVIQSANDQGLDGEAMYQEIFPD